MDIKSQSEYALFRTALACLRPLPYRWSSAFLRRAAHVAGPVLGMRREVVKAQLNMVFPDQSAADLAVWRVRCTIIWALRQPRFCAPNPRRFFVRWTSLRAGTFWTGLWPGAGAPSPPPDTLVILNLVEGFSPDVFRCWMWSRPSGTLLSTIFFRNNGPGSESGPCPVDSSGRAVLAHLRDGGLVTLLMDQDAGKIGFRTDFLGLPASTWPGAARISIRTGCPVVPVAILRNEDRSHTLHIGEALEPRGLTDRHEDIREFTGRISAAVEQFIWDCPEQWFWVHRRWKGAEEARGADEPITEI